MEFYLKAIRFLEACRINVHAEFIRKHLQSHPDYPALIALTDLLSDLGVPHSAIETNQAELCVLNFPLLIHTVRPQQADFEIVYARDMGQKNWAALLEYWDGIVLTIQPGSTIVNTEHNRALKNRRTERATLFTLLALGSALYAFGYIVNFHIMPLILSLLSIAGIFICILIIQQGMGKTNSFTKQLCSGDGQGCDKAISPKLNRLFIGLGLGDIGLVYFSAIFLFLLTTIIIRSVAVSTPILIIPFTASFLFSFLSLWYQGHVIKSWCKMCLLVIAITWLQEITPIVSYAPALPDAMTILCFFFCLLIASVWLLAKPVVTAAQAGKIRDINLLTWRRQPEVFSALLHRQTNVDITTWQDDILLAIHPPEYS